MFLIPVLLVDFCGRFKHVFASLRHICKHKEGASASRLLCVRMLEVEIYSLFSQHLI